MNEQSIPANRSFRPASCIPPRTASLLFQEQMAHTEENRAALQQAILDQDLDLLSTLQMVWTDVILPLKLKPYDGNVSTILLASYYGYTDCIRKLIEKSINLFCLNTIYKTALLLAASRGHKSCIRLLSRFALFNNKHEELEELIITIESQDFDSFYDLLDKSGDKDWFDKTDGSNVLSFLILNDCPLVCLQLLIDKGVSINHHDHHGFTPLMSAIIAGRIEIAHFLLQKGAKVNLHDKKSYSFFKLYSFYDEALKRNEKDGIVNGEKKTALMYAVLSNELQCVNLLLKHGADVNVIDDGGFTALMHAAYLQQSECVKEILSCDQNVNVNKVDNQKRSALIHAAYAGDESSVKLLLKAKANRYDKDCSNRTAFMAAVISNNIFCATSLLKFQAEVDSKDLQGKTSLMYAAEFGNLELLKFLIDKVQKPLHSKKDHAKVIFNNPLFCAIKAGMTACVNELIKNGCDIQCRNDHYETPLMHAANRKDTEIFYLLIKHGADINAVTQRTKDSVLVYALNGNLECMEYLLQSGLRVDQVNHRGKTPLMLACLLGKDDCVRLLIEYGANVNAVDYEFHTPLMKAAMGERMSNVSIQYEAQVSNWSGLVREDGHLNCFELLLDAGADVDMTDKDKHTVLFTILRYNLHTFFKTLIDRGELIEDFNLKKKHRKAFGNNPLRDCHQSIVIIFMKRGIFKWHMYPSSPLRLLFSAVVSGISPGLFPLKPHFPQSSENIRCSEDTKLSPLLSAFLGNDPSFVQFILANLYFTMEDYKTIVCNVKFQNEVRKKYYIPQLISLLDDLISKPWSLQTLSLISISTSITLNRQSSLSRGEQVDSLPIPEKFKTKLKFQGHLSKICPFFWRFIGFPPGCEECQDLLSLSKPLWPFPQNLFPCHLSTCLCNGNGLAVKE